MEIEKTETTSYTIYSGILILVLAVTLFLAFVKSLFISEFLIAIPLFIVSVFLLVITQYIFVTISFTEEKLIAERFMLFWNVLPKNRYKTIKVSFNEISCVRFSSANKGVFSIAVIDKEDNFLFRIEAGSWDYSLLKDEFIKRNIKVLDFGDTDKDLFVQTHNWKKKKAVGYKC